MVKAVILHETGGPEVLALEDVAPVSYTHLTLPTMQ